MTREVIDMPADRNQRGTRHDEVPACRSVCTRRRRCVFCLVSYARPNRSEHTASSITLAGLLSDKTAPTTPIEPIDMMASRKGSLPVSIHIECVTSEICD